MAADLMLVLVTTMGLGLARACPVPTTTRKGCDIGMFKSLLPSELVAFKKAKDGNSLAVQWLGLHALTAGSRFDPWSGNQDPTSRGARPKKKSQRCLRKSLLWANLYTFYHSQAAALLLLA